MSINVATDENYKELINDGFVIVDYYTTTCVPCKMFSRVLEELTLDYPFVNIVKVNITDYPAIGNENEIDGVPTVKFIMNGEEKEKVVGLMSEDEVVEKISEYYYA